MKDWNVLKKIQGQIDIDLNDEGRRQAEETAQNIGDRKVDLIITSPLKRAKETAEIINKRFNVPIIEDKRLLERGFGEFEGVTKDERNELKKIYPDIEYMWDYDKNVDVKGMEKVQVLCARIFSLLDEVTQKYSDKTVLLVTHGGTSVPIQCYFKVCTVHELGNRQVVRGLNNCEVAEFDV